jgi:succinate dehydrogenase / fumarate reductase cytochrome b subunit
MSSAASVFSYSIGKKLVMGLSGLFLVSFLFVHVGGNSLLFLNDDGVAFNEFVQFMTTNPVVGVLEWVLFAGFIIHIVYAFILTWQNRQARPVRYAYNKPSGSTWFSRNMFLTGSIVLAFLAIHITMFYGRYHFAETSSDITETVSLNQAYTLSYKVLEEVRNGDQVLLDAKSYLTDQKYQLVKEAGMIDQMVKGVSMTSVVKASFSIWYIVLFYVLAMVLLAFHLTHGFQSSFRTAGFVHKKYTPLIKAAGYLIAVVVPITFAMMPVVFFFR